MLRVDSVVSDKAVRYDTNLYAIQIRSKKSFDIVDLVKFESQ